MLEKENAESEKKTVAKPANVDQEFQDFLAKSQIQFSQQFKPAVAKFHLNDFVKLNFKHQQRQTYSYHSVQQFEQPNEQSVLLGEPSMSVSSSSCYTSQVMPKPAAQLIHRIFAVHGGISHYMSSLQDLELQNRIFNDFENTKEQ